ncbi:pirin family protein [Mucilaginibacter sp. Mucisp84]|uniref:pirin family protein n=1 Tax=Mucilaginibacter sp. Mucisp84 TaxID=3243058 RepID=UPI0039A70918
MKKVITHILAGREKKITAEETVRQPLPHKDFRFANPFIVLHHMGPEIITPGQTLRIHPHPHRGFSPYTIMLQGEGYHKDNAGNDEIIKAGDVQWMFAGKGIMHSEGPTAELLQKGGVQELIHFGSMRLKVKSGMSLFTSRPVPTSYPKYSLAKASILTLPAEIMKAKPDQLKTSPLLFLSLVNSRR